MDSRDSWGIPEKGRPWGDPGPSGGDGEWGRHGVPGSGASGGGDSGTLGVVLGLVATVGFVVLILAVGLVAWRWLNAVDERSGVATAAQSGVVRSDAGNDGQAPVVTTTVTRQAPGGGSGGDRGATGGLNKSGSGSGDAGGSDAAGKNIWLQDPSWKECSGWGSSGEYRMAYAATSVTTCPFTVNVADQVWKNLRQVPNPMEISAYSPALGRKIVMNCVYGEMPHGTSSTATWRCEGGNNAVVYVGVAG